MSLRPDLQQILDAFDAADRAALALSARLTDRQFTWQPGGVAWSVALCLDHLATANELYGGKIAAAVEEARRKGVTGGGPIAPSFFGRRFVASLEPPVKMKTKAPASIRPRQIGSRDEILRQFVGAHDRLRAVLAAAPDVDLNRTTFPNPFLPLVKMRAGTALRVITAHDRRHLWQANQVTKAPGFPPA